MRVLHVYSGNLFGGVERFLVTLVQEKEACPEMQSSFALCFEGRLQSELEGAGAKVYRLGAVRISRPWTVWRARKRLAVILKEEQFDIAICHSVWPEALFGPVVRSNGLPLVFWCHDAPSGSHWLERWAKRIPPDLVIANSHYTSKAVLNLYPGVPTQVIYYLVHPPGIKNLESLRCKLRAGLETPGDAVVIIQASRLEQWKGQRVLLSALGQLLDLPRWVCWLAGGPQRPHEKKYLEELKEEAKTLGILDRIRFLGQRDDIAELLRAADIYCQPNTGPEPFGIVFVEALYAGLPVVTTAIGGATEIVNESCGHLIPPNDLRALADVLRLLIVNPMKRSTLAAGGPLHAPQLCDPEKQLSRLHSVLSHLVKERLPA